MISARALGDTADTEFYDTRSAAQTVLCMDVYTFMNDEHHTFQQDNYSKQSQKGFLNLIIHRIKHINQRLQMGMHFWPSPPHQVFPEEDMDWKSQNLLSPGHYPSYYYREIYQF